MLMWRHTTCDCTGQHTRDRSAQQKADRRVVGGQTVPNETRPRWAFATYCTNSNYELGSRTVLLSARRTSTVNASLLLLHTHKLTTGWTTLPIETRRVEVPHTRKNHYYSDVLTKLLVFKQTTYQRIVYVESDGIVMRDLSHLFRLTDPLYIPHCRWCDPGFVTNVLMVLTPSNATWDRLERTMRAKPTMMDMDVVNFELREDISRLSSRYAMLNSLFEDREPEAFYGDTFDKVYDAALYFHFTAVGKPWAVERSTLEALVREKRCRPQMMRLFEHWNEHLRLSYNASEWSVSRVIA